MDESDANPGMAKVSLRQQTLNVNIEGQHEPTEAVRLPVICALVQDMRTNLIGVWKNVLAVLPKSCRFKQTIVDNDKRKMEKKTVFET